jgi:hypothetical protein
MESGRRAMIDETSIKEEKAWYYEQRAMTVIKNFERKNIDAKYVHNRKEALAAVLKMIPTGAVVHRGDSVTLDQVGIFQTLKDLNQNRIIDPTERDEQGFWLVPDREDRDVIQREAFTSDIFLTGTNAITLDGKLVNIDAIGNRVAPMIFGPKKVIVVAGANKIVKDVEEGLVRIRDMCVRVNGKRHALKHHLPQFGDLPCIRSGKCVDCNYDWCACRYTVIINGAIIWRKGRTSVILVGEELGI